MKRILYVVDAILIIAGGIFFLQGLRILPSPLMYGKQEWVIIGAAMVIVGVVSAIFAYRRE